MKKITFYLTLFSILLIVNSVTSQSDEICDYTKLSHRWPTQFDDYQIEFYVVFPYLPDDVEITRHTVQTGERGKVGVEYILELFDENDNLISKVIKKPSEYSSAKDGKYTYTLNKNIKEYHQVYLKFTFREYIVLSNTATNEFTQRVDDMSCKNVKVKGGAESPGGDLPNLTLKGFKIKKDSKTWDLMSGQRPVLTKDASKAYEFTIIIENKGKIRANDARIWVGLSSTNKYPDPSIPAYGIYTHDYGYIDKSSSKSQTRIVFVYDNMGSSPKLSNRQYYLLIDIDPDGKINESNENDNIWSFPFQYASGSIRPTDPIAGIEPFHETLNANLQIQRPYEVQVYDIYGRKILTKKVENEEGEKAIINDLSTGYYIFKSENGDRKVAKGQ